MISAMPQPMRESYRRGMTRSKPCWLRVSESSRITGVMAAVWKAYPFAENAGMRAASTHITGTSHQPRGTSARTRAARRSPAAVPKARSTAREKTEPKSGFMTKVTVSATQYERGTAISETSACASPMQRARRSPYRQDASENRTARVARRARTRSAAGRPSRSSTL